MNICLCCGRDTKNPKFCSSSCSATYNNKLYPKKRKKIYGYCQICNKPIMHRRHKSLCSHLCYSKYRWTKKVKQIEETGFVHPDTCFHSSPTGRRYLIEKYGHQCSVCKITEWMGKPTPLVLDHIDGHPNNWAISNLRLICPNCDAQSSTFTGRNVGNGGRPQRRVGYIKDCCS